MPKNTDLAPNHHFHIGASMKCDGKLKKKTKKNLLFFKLFFQGPVTSPMPKKIFFGSKSSFLNNRVPLQSGQIVEIMAFFKNQIWTKCPDHDICFF